MHVVLRYKLIPVLLYVNRKHKSHDVQRQTADTHVVYDNVTGAETIFTFRSALKRVTQFGHYFNILRIIISKLTWFCDGTQHPEKLFRLTCCNFKEIDNNIQLISTLE